jgi:predicted HD phosphohydrolase
MTTVGEGGRVPFRRMHEASEQDWNRIDELERRGRARVVERITKLLLSLRTIVDGFPVDRLIHSCQTATRAERDGADLEWVVAALCHDVGMAISGDNHAAIAAAMLKPYVDDDIAEVIRTHDAFQGRYYFSVVGLDPQTYLKYRKEQWFDDALRFSDRWDEVSFDPDYDTFPLTHFKPALQAVFGQPRVECVPL